MSVDAIQIGRLITGNSCCIVTLYILYPLFTFLLSNLLLRRYFHSFGKRHHCSHFVFLHFWSMMNIWMYWISTSSFFREITKMIHNIGQHTCTRIQCTHTHTHYTQSHIDTHIHRHTQTDHPFFFLSLQAWENRWSHRGPSSFSTRKRSYNSWAIYEKYTYHKSYCVLLCSWAVYGTNPTMRWRLFNLAVR